MTNDLAAREAHISEIDPFRRGTRLGLGHDFFADGEFVARFPHVLERYLHANSLGRLLGGAIRGRAFAAIFETKVNSKPQASAMRDSTS